MAQSSSICRSLMPTAVRRPSRNGTAPTMAPPALAPILIHCDTRARSPECGVMSDIMPHSATSWNEYVMSHAM